MRNWWLSKKGSAQRVLPLLLFSPLSCYFCNEPTKTTNLARDRDEWDDLLNMEINMGVAYKSMSLLSSWTTIGYLGSTQLLGFLSFTYSLFSGAEGTAHCVALNDWLTLFCVRNIFMIASRHRAVRRFVTSALVSYQIQYWKCDGRRNHNSEGFLDTQKVPPLHLLVQVICRFRDVGTEFSDM